ncbi:MAG: YdeI/OmpD-associated family protein, partial [Bacteroidota bacterium]
GIGEEVKVVLWRDEKERKVGVPSDLAKVMKKEKLLEFFESLSYTHQKEYSRWITEAKKEETKQSRLEKAIQMLKKKVKTPG